MLNREVELLTFDEETHSYFLGEEHLVSVTQAIREWVEFESYGLKYMFNRFTGTVIPMKTIELARRVGKAVHKGSKFLIEGTLEWDGLNELVIPHLKSVEQWAIDYRVKPEILEVPMCSLRHRYAGTPDFVGYIKGDKYLSVIDYASGAYGMKECQTAAYEQLVREVLKYRGRIKRYCLQTGEKYRLIPFTDTGDFGEFLNHLNIYRRMKGRGIWT